MVRLLAWASNQAGAESDLREQLSCLSLSPIRLEMVAQSDERRLEIKGLKKAGLWRTLNGSIKNGEIALPPVSAVAGAANPLKQTH